MGKFVIMVLDFLSLPVATGWKSGQICDPDFGSSINAGGDGVEEWAN